MLEVSKWISIVHGAWHSLVDDFERFGDVTGYGHMCEEDIRSYLFCKISDMLRKRGEWLINLHAEQSFLRKRADIVIGLGDDESWLVGVEVKRVGQRKPLREDLDKLRAFMKNGNITAGVLAAIVKHDDDWETLFKEWDFSDEFKLEPRDEGSNNYWEIRELKKIVIGKETYKWDSLFFVLRTL